MPQNLHGAAGVSNGTYAYAAGGVNAGGTTLDTFYRYNPVNERWDTYPPPMPAALEMASAVYYPTTNSIYVFGGKNGSVFSNASWVFDIAANTWTPVANMPAPRASWRPATTAPTGGSTWSAGTTPTGPQTTIWEYVPGTNTFITTRAQIPHPVAGAASGIIAGHLYVAGGHDASTVLNTTWDYSIGAGYLDGTDHHADSDRCARQRRCERKALGLRRRDSVHPERDDCCLRSGRQQLDERAEPERRSLGPGGRCDREHARRPRAGTRARRRRQRRRCWMRDRFLRAARHRRSARTSTA